MGEAFTLLALLSGCGAGRDLRTGCEESQETAPPLPEPEVWRALSGYNPATVEWATGFPIESVSALTVSIDRAQGAAAVWVCTGANPEVAAVRLRIPVTYIVAVDDGAVSATFNGDIDATGAGLESTWYAGTDGAGGIAGGPATLNSAWATALGQDLDWQVFLEGSLANSQLGLSGYPDGSRNVAAEWIGTMAEAVDTGA